MRRSSVRPSVRPSAVCLSHRPTTAAACGRFAAERSAGRRYRLTAADSARNSARCTQAKKTTHGLDGQHQDVDRTPRERVSRKDRGQRYIEKVRP